jgi:hypothetical protein
VRLGCSTRGCGETDAVFEVREEAVQFESLSAAKAARVFGVGEIGGTSTFYGVNSRVPGVVGIEVATFLNR